MVADGVAKEVPYTTNGRSYTQTQVDQLDFLVWLADKTGVKYEKSDDPKLMAVAIVVGVIEFSGYLAEDWELEEWGIVSNI